MAIPRISPSPAAVRLFVAAAVPAGVRTALRSTLAAFQPAIAGVVPEERWHLTLVFIGTTAASDAAAAALAGSLSQLYTPTVHITHLGAGKARGQLWAYAEPTELLLRLRSAVASRLAAAGISPAETERERPFVPHIRLASLVPERSRLLPTVPAGVSFPIRELLLYASVPEAGGVRYEPRSRLRLSS